MGWPVFTFPKIRLPTRATLTSIIKVPDINSIVNNLKKSVLAFKLPSIDKLINAGKNLAINAARKALAPFENRLRQITGALNTVLAPGALEKFVGNVIQSGINTVTKIVEDTVNGAIAGAVGAIYSIVGGVLEKATAIINKINGLTDKVNAAYEKPRELLEQLNNKTADIVQGTETTEANTIAGIVGKFEKNANKYIFSRFGNIKTRTPLSLLATTGKFGGAPINFTTQTPAFGFKNPFNDISKLTNREKKLLSGNDPKSLQAKAVLVSQATAAVVRQTSKEVVAEIKSETYPAQVTALNKVEATVVDKVIEGRNAVYGIPDSRIKRLTRLQRISYLNGLKNDFDYNDNKFFPKERKVAIADQIKRLENLTEIYPSI